MEQEKHDEWVRVVKALKKNRGQEDAILKILRLLEDILETLAP